MRAILVAKHNRRKIVESTDQITLLEVDAMIGEYGRPEGMRLYFIPHYDPTPQVPHSRWGTMPEGFLEGRYNYDAELIVSEFVEITPK